MHVIPIAGCDPTSLCRFCLVLVLVVCFSCFCCVVFGLLFCFLVLLLGQFLDCVLVHNRHFCGFRQVIALHVNYNSTVCREWICVTTWRNWVWPMSHCGSVLTTDVRVWRSRSARVRCEDQMWRCEDLDLQVWGCEDLDQQVWNCEDLDLQMWRCEDVKI